MVEDKATPEQVKNSPEKVCSGMHKVHKMIALGLVGALVLATVFIGAKLVERGARGRVFRNDNNVLFNQDTRAGGFGMMRGEGGFGKELGRGMMGQNQIFGKVTVVNGKKFTIEASGNKYDVQIGNDTRFGIDSSTAVKVGDQVSVFGGKDSSGVIQAISIVVE